MRLAVSLSRRHPRFDVVLRDLPLTKIAGAAQRRPMYSAERNPAMAHMYIVNPLSGARMDNHWVRFA